MGIHTYELSTQPRRSRLGAPPGCPLPAQPRLGPLCRCAARASVWTARARAVRLVEQRSVDIDWLGTGRHPLAEVGAAFTAAAARTGLEVVVEP